MRCAVCACGVCCVNNVVHLEGCCDTFCGVERVCMCESVRELMVISAPVQHAKLPADFSAIYYATNLENPR